MICTVNAMSSHLEKKKSRQSFNIQSSKVIPLQVVSQKSRGYCSSHSLVHENLPHIRPLYLAIHPLQLLPKRCFHQTSKRLNILFIAMYLDSSWSKRDNLVETLLSELSSNNTGNSGTKGLVLVINKDTSIVVESDNRAVGSLRKLLGADNNSMSHVTLTELKRRSTTNSLVRDGSGLLDDNDDSIADTGTVLGALSKNLDALGNKSTRVVDDVDHRL